MYVCLHYIELCVALNCVCVQTSVYLWCMCVSVCDRWLGCPPRPCTSGAHAGGLHRSPCVCVLFAGVFPPCVCVPWQRVFSPRRPGINAAALMAADGELWASRGNLPDEHTRRRRGTLRFYGVFFFFFFFKSKVTAELKVIHRLTHCCFYCLIKDNLVFPKVLYYVLWVCLKTTLTQCVYMTLKKNELLCSPDYDRIFKMHVYTSVWLKSDRIGFLIVGLKHPDYSIDSRMFTFHQIGFCVLRRRKISFSGPWAGSRRAAATASVLRNHRKKERKSAIVHLVCVITPYTKCTQMELRLALRTPSFSDAESVCCCWWRKEVSCGCFCYH